MFINLSLLELASLWLQPCLYYRDGGRIGFITYNNSEVLLGAIIYRPDTTNNHNMTAIIKLPITSLPIY